MKYPAAIFDFDGTLLDTLDDLADSMNQVLAEFKFPPHPVHPYRFFVGDGMVNLAKRAAPEGTSDETVQNMAKLMDVKYGAGWHNKTRPYDGVVDMVNAMKAMGMKVAILSNKPDSFTQIMARHYFDGMFDMVLGARDNVPKKPDPAAALEIARAFGFAPKEFIYFGDTNTDMRTGLAAGMFTVGVTWGFRPVEELTGAGAQAIIDAPAEALKLL